MSSSKPSDPESMFPVPQNHDRGAVANNDIGPCLFPIVGVGASAGGLEAYHQLLARLPDNTGMAFVLIQHLDPHHESRLRFPWSWSVPTGASGAIPMPRAGLLTCATATSAGR